jgi:hypothetical protein
MTMMRKIMFGGAAFAALATAAPSAAQYGYNANPYGNNGYGNNGYGNNGYGYNGDVTSMAAQQCSAAVQNRLSRGNGLGGIVGALFGGNNNNGGRVLSVTQATPRGQFIRVRGLASSGSRAGFGQYGAGAYGALGYSYQPDLSFRCDVDFRGQVRNVDINRR